ncbi:MAG: glycosyltransferase, partial [bacterium]
FKKILHPDFHYLVTYHMDVVGAGFKAWFFSTYSKILMPMVLRGADKVLVSSRDYALTSPLLAPVYQQIEEKIIELPFPAPKLSALISPRDKKYFVLVAGLDRAHYFKGVEVLLKAFQIARSRLSDYELKIVGDGDLRNHYEQLAERLGIADGVRFLGSVAHGPEFSEAVGNAEALVFPSVDRSEAFGLVLLEALALSVPVIASDLPGVRTVATSEVGLTFPVGDPTALALALVKMATESGLRERLSGNCHRVIFEKFSLERYAQGLEEILGFENEDKN